MKNVIRMTHKGGSKPPIAPPSVPLRKPKIVDALFDDRALDRIAADIVDRGRELTSRQDKVDYWLARTAHFRAIGRSEGADPGHLEAGLQLLSRAVRTENERRHRLAIAAATFDIPFLGFETEPTQPAEILRFPAEPDLDENEAILPEGFR